MRASLLVVLPVIAVEVAVRGANEQIKCHVPKNTLQIYDLFEYQQRIWEKMWGVPLFSAWPSRTFCKGKEKVLEGLLENKGWLFLNKGALLENNLGVLRWHTRHNLTAYLHTWNAVSSCLIRHIVMLETVFLWWPSCFLMKGHPLLDDRPPASWRWTIVKKQVIFP